jgi:hypothetical protein
MAPNVLEELLIRLQNHHLMKHPQRDIVLQLASIPPEPAKNVQVCLVLLAPSLK